MNILGFNAYQHDSAAALVQDGKVVAASAEERFTRKKHDGGFPENAINFCLEDKGLSIDDIDYVAFYWDPYKGMIQRAFHVIKHLPKSLFLLSSRGTRWGKIRRIKEIFSEKVGRGNYKFVCVDHHLAHMYGTFFGSGFDEAAILIMDGAGEWATTTLGMGRGNKIQKLKAINFPNSLGNLYSAFTQYLGFKPHSGEGKVMGLAPYGNPQKYIRVFEDILKIEKNGEYNLNLRYFGHHLGQEIRYSQHLVDKLGPPRAPETKMDKKYEDIAAGLQEILERCGISIANYLHEITGSKNLCLAGGVALNSVMNYKILLNTKFENIYIHPPATDDGSSAGAALYVWHKILSKEERHCLPDVYLGPEYDNASIEEELKGAGLRYEYKKNIEEEAARLLADGKIVGWFQGRSELGPRALGNRTILADPRKKEMKDILNARVKHREGFRPFAPTVLEEKSSEYFKDFGLPSPYMILVWEVIEDKKDEIPAVVHVDGTARVQTISRDCNPRYYKLIEEFEKITGVPVILNTSFNVRGKPIVNTPEEAFECFLNTDMDNLAIGDFLVSK